MGHRRVIANVGEPTCRHEFVKREKEQIQVMVAACVNCGAIHVHTNADETMLSDLSLKTKHGGK